MDKSTAPRRTSSAASRTPASADTDRPRRAATGDVDRARSPRSIERRKAAQATEAAQHAKVAALDDIVRQTPPTELARSLEAFIACNGQWEAAARRLYCHRHTLRYRIRKVEELTGRDLGNARDRIEFWLALRARELADAQSRPALPA